MKTFSQKPADVTRKWYVIDAQDTTLGRLATQIAKLLMGKEKPTFTPHVDGGDYVVITNAQHLRVTGGKEQKKIYYRHSSHPGGLKSQTLAELMERDPTKAIIFAVRGMLPVNKLRDGRLARLKVYPGEEHQHTAQQPEKLSIKETS